MPQTIYPLDPLTIDKIAAGEVIESPASCVKELIDNSIDAEATSLLIEIQLGGRELILIQDDGKGMCLDDMKLCCERHTTSKIRSIDDLETLSSRGFRGEALSSIASISKLTIRSREKTKDQEAVGLGGELLIEGGKTIQLQEVSAPFGTQMTVQSLFYNVPARRKFLKPPSKNALEIVKTVKQLALISPAISFTLISDKKTIFSAEKTDSLQARIKDVLNEPFTSSSRPIFVQKEGISIHGLLVNPSEAKRNRTGQYLFVNGRPITSQFISYVIKSAYASSLATDEYPQFALSLQLDPDRVDMNVHPQKKEVRFADEEWIRQELYEAVSHALFGTKQETFTPIFFQQQEKEPSVRRQEETAVIFAPRPRKPCIPTLPLFTETAPSHCPQPKVTSGTLKQHLLIGPYVLVTMPTNERLIVNLVQALLATVSQKVTTTPESQFLLQPEIIELGTLERDSLEEKIPHFASLGFTLSRFGSNSLLVEAIPSYLEQEMALSCLRELIEADLHGELSSDQVLQHFTKSLPELSEDKIDSSLAEKILSHWIQIGAPTYTRSGKKVSMPLEKKHLETLFEGAP